MKRNWCLWSIPFHTRFRNRTQTTFVSHRSSAFLRVIRLMPLANQLTLPVCMLDPRLLSLSLVLRPTVSGPVCLWIKRPSGAHDQIVITVWQLHVCWSGALSLTRGRVCRLELLLALTSAVLLGSESRGTRSHILLSQIRDFPLVASYDSQGYGGGIRPHLHTSWHRLRRKHRFPHWFHCYVCVSWGDHVTATEALPSNGRCLQSHSLATAVSAGFTILPWANMPHYEVLFLLN
jgi:hypothetical protein